MRNYNLRNTALVMLIVISSGCAGKQKPPNIRFDNIDFEPSIVMTEEIEATKFIIVPEPLPLPGQLKPIEQFRHEKQEDVSPAERVDNANNAAKVEPNQSGYVNAIQVQPFSKGALYRLYTAPEQVSDVVLQEGEKLVSVSAGDTVQWIIGDTTSGAEPNEQVHILIKPTVSDLKTNMVVTTDRRTYYLEMISFENTYMASLSWRYPHDELISLRHQNEQSQQVRNRVIDTGINLDHLRFRYEVTGDNPPWRPTRAFDDGQKVYIEFPRGIAQGEAPPLFVVGPEGDNELVNYRMKGRFYIVDQLFAAAELRLGANPQQVIRISRTDGRNSNEEEDNE